MSLNGIEYESSTPLPASDKKEYERYVVVPISGSNFIVKIEDYDQSIRTISYKKDSEKMEMTIEGPLYKFFGVNARKEAIFLAENIPGQVVWLNTYEEEKSLNNLSSIIK